MSSKEKQAKRRLKIKESDEADQSHLKKDRERKQAQRSSSKDAMSKSQFEEHRMKERLRIREFRLKKKSQEKATCSPIASIPYRSTQARGKAIKRAQSALPSSPRKRQCVVESLAKTVGLQVNDSPLSTPHGYSAISEETKQLVHALTTMILPGRLLGIKIESLLGKRVVMAQKPKELSSCDTC